MYCYLADEASAGASGGKVYGRGFPFPLAMWVSLLLRVIVCNYRIYSCTSRMRV